MLNMGRAVPYIPVSDRGRAIGFYSGTLGLELYEETGGDVVFAAAGGTLIGAYVSDHAGKAGHTLAAFFVDDLDATMAELRDRGIYFEEYDFPELKTVDGVADLDGERGAWFKDPDGNILGLGQRLSGK
jgi:catechol 2,3-dioxygenase-like lactoylglutathione lyase family enzyme